MGEADALDVEDVLVVLLVLLVEPVVSGDGFSALHPARPKTAAMPTAPIATSVSYTHLTLPTKSDECRSRWSPYH